MYLSAQYKSEVAKIIRKRVTNIMKDALVKSHYEGDTGKQVKRLEFYHFLNRSRFSLQKFEKEGSHTVKLMSLYRTCAPEKSKNPL